MAKAATQFADVVNEESTQVWAGVLADSAGSPIGSGALDTLVMSFFDLESGTIVNSRSGQDILNANNVVVDGSGVITWTLQPADTTLIDATKTHETHRAEIRGTYNSGAGTLKHDVDFKIRNFVKLP